MPNHAQLINLCRSLLLSLVLGFGGMVKAEVSLALDYQLKGLAGAPQQNALQRLKDIQARYGQGLTRETIIKLYQQAPKEIKLAIQPFGYFNAVISKQLERRGGKWLAVYTINPGPAIKISHVSISIEGPGAHDPKLQDFVRQYPLKSGDRLLTEKHEQAKQKFFDVAQNQGYLTAAIKHSAIRVDRAKNQASITCQFNTGPRYYFGPVNFNTTVLSQKFLQRYLPFKQGETYSSAKLLRLQEYLSSSPYFNQVLITPKPASAQIVPIDVELKPRPAQEYNLGAGYGTDTGLRGSLGLHLRRLNTMGQRFTADLKASKINHALLANYIFPGTHPSTDEYRILAGIGSEERGQGTSNIRQVGTSYTHKLGNWQQTAMLVYQYETYRLNPDADNRLSQLLIPSINWTKTQADNLIYPQHGYSTQFTLRTAIDKFISDNHFLQARLQYKWLTSLGTNSRILLRTDLGYTLASHPDNLPLSIRFFSGGSKSVRGYSFQGLGPGRYLTEGSVEYQHRLWGNWHGALFYDIGNAYNHFNEGLKQGLGLGIVWVSPIGPINLSLARAMNSPDHPLLLQFSMGPDL
jgi:translocation and assembly module TamA